MAGIECFVPSMSGEDISVTVESFSRSSAFTGVTILAGVSLKSTETTLVSEGASTVGDGTTGARSYGYISSIIF